MIVQVDLKFDFTPETKEVVFSEIDSLLPKEYGVSVKKNRGIIYFIDEEQDVEMVREAISPFIKGLLCLKHVLLPLERLLDVALYYDLSETVVCPVFLDENIIAMLNQLNLSIRITGYPCKSMGSDSNDF